METGILPFYDSTQISGHRLCCLPGSSRLDPTPRSSGTTGVAQMTGYSGSTRDRI